KTISRTVCENPKGQNSGKVSLHKIHSQKGSFVMTITADSNFAISRNLSEEKVARDWTLSENDKLEINKYRKIFRPFIAVQLCAIRLYGRFLGGISDLSPQIINYINHQIDLPPSLSIQVPEREA